MTSDLIARIEAAQPGETRGLLEEAFNVIFGPVPPSEYDGRAWTQNKPDFSPAWENWTKANCRFRNLLDAEAYLDAAVMLVPPALFPTIDFVNCRVWIRTADNYDLDTGTAYGFAKSVPLSLAAASLKAKDASDGMDA